MPEGNNYNMEDKSEMSEIMSEDVFAPGGMKTGDKFKASVKAMKEEEEMQQTSGLGACVIGAFAFIQSLCPVYCVVNSQIKGALVASGGLVLQEKRADQKAPDHTHRHKIEENIGGSAAAGEGHYVFREHHEKTESTEAQGKKPPNLF